MSARIIRITYDLTPATATTCGDGSGRFCRLYSHDLRGLGTCALFGRLTESEGWVQRHPDCIRAEANGGLRV